MAFYRGRLAHRWTWCREFRDPWVTAFLTTWTGLAPKAWSQEYCWPRVLESRVADSASLLTYPLVTTLPGRRSWVTVAGNLPAAETRLTAAFDSHSAADYGSIFWNASHSRLG